MTTASLPILYNFRRCPYAMRARMAIYASGLTVELREVVLKNKPAEMLECSPKGTVPVLVLENGKVVDESRDIINFALAEHDPLSWVSALTDIQLTEMDQLIDINDQQFKGSLDRYKYPNRYLIAVEGEVAPTAEELLQYGLNARRLAENFLQDLEQRLNQHRFLLGDNATMADIAIFPFIRQFAHVDKIWFDQAPYPALQRWLAHWLDSPLFQAIMKKYPAWQPEDAPLYFGQLHIEP